MWFLQTKDSTILDSLVPGEEVDVQVTIKCAYSPNAGHWSSWSHPVRAMVPQSAGVLKWESVWIWVSGRALTWDLLCHRCNLWKKKMFLSSSRWHFSNVLHIWPAEDHLSLAWEQIWSRPCVQTFIQNNPKVHCYIPSLKNVIHWIFNVNIFSWVLIEYKDLHASKYTPGTALVWAWNVAIYWQPQPFRSFDIVVHPVHFFGFCPLKHTDIWHPLLWGCDSMWYYSEVVDWTQWTECLAEENVTEVCHFRGEEFKRVRVKLASSSAPLSRTFYSPEFTLRSSGEGLSFSASGRVWVF